MKVLPFFLTQKKQENFRIQCLNVFLSHAGKSVWKTEESGVLSEKQIREDYLDPNGFAVKSLWIDANAKIAYVEIDPSRTNLCDFYTWDEALQHPGKPECWRPFYFIQDKEGVSWWNCKGLFEADIQDLGNMETIFQTLSEKKYNQS